MSRRFTLGEIYLDVKILDRPGHLAG